MHYRSNRNGYVCGTYSKHGVHFCTSHVIKEDTLYKVVLDDLNNLLQPLDSSYVIKTMKPMLQSKIKQLKKQQVIYKHNLKKIQKENDLAYKRLITGTISRDEYTYFMNLESQNISLIKEKLSFTELLLSHLSNPNTLNILLENITNQYVTSLSSSILNTFISRIEIGENDALYIHYNFLVPVHI